MSLFLTVLLMEILSGAEVDIFVPSFPELQRVYNLSPFMVELALFVNLTAHCISAFIAGTLGDKYGRKPTIIVSLLIFIIGSLLCIFAPSYSLFLMGRFLQGIGISGPTVLAYILIADRYSITKQQSLMGILNAAITLAMAFAPVVGSYVCLYFSWQANFIILLGMAILCLGASLLFIPPDTHHSQNNVSLNIDQYIVILRSKKVRYFALTISLLLTPYWIFLGLSPIYYMNALSVPLKEFGFYQGSLAASFSLVSLSSGLFLKKFGQKNCFYAGIFLIILFMLLCTCLLLFQVQDPILIILTTAVLAIGIVFPLNILWPMSLEAIPNARGRITAIMVAARLILSALGIQTASYFYQGTFTFIGLAMIFCLALGIFYYYRLLQEDPIF